MAYRGLTGKITGPLQLVRSTDDADGEKEYTVRSKYHPTDGQAAEAGSQQQAPEQSNTTQ
eukprot:CAMPEP_0114609636 /NCGR_PEP_ID=MMETSP0168-20121206/3189_1 /TAXON_ID=95228 ORGANISM="Vannella sp., Strain DIVA3 517/6/12" /NCGR_SAMPLE_ID=MMETSP0168 /ASSEMBLY_ACC=CAM_ASM_000044 /LENGTH=59 /DNA_ID=CAMNT_0001820557 /DNA_START=71 /DNA_END=250 /DNA_ORIENTATION=+